MLVFSVFSKQIKHLGIEEGARVGTGGRVIFLTFRGDRY